MNDYYHIGLDWGVAKNLACQLTKPIKCRIRREAAEGATAAVKPVARACAARGAREAVTPMVVGVGLLSVTAIILALRK